jgi:hypothetical protein
MTSPLHRIAPATALVLAGLLPATALAGQHEHGAAAMASHAITAKLAPPKADLGPLPPLPRGYAVRPMEQVQQVFEFAARHPEVLSYVPCYCGCERMGHTGNHDCFVKSRNAAGKVTEWEPHGLICEVCLDVGRDAMLMFNSGASVSAIRTAIETRYGSHYPSSTPTPRPPAPKTPAARKAAPSSKAPSSR